MKKFKHLNVPSHWEHYWSKYPEGYTILEALLNWVDQVDGLTDNVNDWNEYLNKFVAQFDTELQASVEKILREWKDDGTLDHIINDTIFSWKADKSYVDDRFNTNEIEIGKKANKTYVDDRFNKNETEIDKKANKYVYRFQPSGQSDLDHTPTENSEDPVNTIIGYKDNAVGRNMRGVHVQQGSKFNENIVGGDPSTIGEAEVNKIDPLIDNAHYSMIGGYDNVVNALASLVISMHSYVKDVATHGAIYGGSFHNIIAGDYSGLFGGTMNTIDIADGGGYGFIGGGNGNSIHGKFSTAGGFRSRIGTPGSFKGHGSFVGTGEYNTIDGDYAHIVTGNLCKATKDYSSASGLNAVANNFGERAFSNGMFTVGGDRGSSELSMSRETKDNVPVQLLLDGESAAPLMPTYGVLTITGIVTGIRTDVHGELCSFEVNAVISTMNGQPVVKSKEIKTLYNDIAADNLTADIDIVATDTRYEVRVAGMLQKVIRWHGDFKTVWVRNI